MGEVYLNGEHVDFQGPAPETPLEVWSVLENFLGQSRMLIDRMEVDGNYWMPGGDDGAVSYGEIQAFSVSQSEKATQIATELLDLRESIVEQWQNASRIALREPWSSFQAKAIELLDATQPFVQSASVLVAFGQESEADWAIELQRAANALNSGIELLIDAYEAGDCAKFSDTASGPCLKGIGEVNTVLRSMIKAIGDRVE
jgi:hypothetical protein